jgi:twinkle protein
MTKSAKDISEMLAARVLEVCQKLLPGGKQHGPEWECGDISGREGKSCKVRLSGGKAGIWSDFAAGEAGDLLDLWAQVRGIALKDAIREAKEWLGVAEPRFEPARKQYAAPKKNVQKLERALEYLTAQRKLTLKTLEEYKVAEDRGGESIVFPFISPEGELLNLKHLALKREADKKKLWTESNCAPALFGWQAFQGGRAIAITEGEIDAMTLHQYGIAALSIPFGAGGGNKNDWIDYEWENLEQFDLIHLCYDSDDAGQAAVLEVVKRLGIHRCKSVTFPFKDANECLQNDVPGDVIAECFVKGRTFSPDEIRTPESFRQSVHDYIHPPPTSNVGFAPGFFGGFIALRPAELTVWTGQSGHGKSVILGQVMIEAMGFGERVAIASMEMKPQQTIGRIVRQIWQWKTPPKEDIDTSLQWLQNRLWIYDVMGNIAPKRLLELMEYSRQRHGVTHFVVDSLMKCSVGSDDYDAQRVFLNDVVSFAKSSGCHVHLVAHSRKGDEDEVSGRMDIKGSSDIGNQADNVLTVWRNKAKTDPNKKSKIESDAVVYCDKQRESGWEGCVNLSFMPSCGQYYNPRIEPREYWKDLELPKHRAD